MTWNLSYTIWHCGAHSSILTRSGEQLGTTERSGWYLTVGFPQVRLNARDNASLAASVHLICRPRPGDASVGDWSDVLRQLPRRAGDWVERLQGEGIRGADLVFACIGPPMEIFSRYSKVETPEGREVKLPEFFEKVWEVVDRTALEQVLGTAEARARNSAAGVLEEDARLTALFLWTLQATDHEEPQASILDNDDETEEEQEEEAPPSARKPGFSLIYDVVRQFAQPLGIHPSASAPRSYSGKVALISPPTASSAHPRARHSLTSSSMTWPRSRKSARAAAPDEALRTRREATTLDRVHAAMLLQASGRSNALRALLKAEVERSPDFLRLANALSALYPLGTEEKRLVQAMAQTAPR